MVSFLKKDSRSFIFASGPDPLAPVAQLDRASDFGSEGWGFESLRARHIFQQLTLLNLIFFAVVFTFCFQTLRYLRTAAFSLMKAMLTSLSIVVNR